LALLLQQYRQQQRQKIKRILQNFKQHCQQQYGQRLVKLVLFGSQARGDFKPSSDIDVLVVLKDPLDEQSDLDKILDFQVDVSLNEAELLNCIFMGENEFQTCQSLLVRNIQQDGIVFYECNPTGVDGRGWR
jgi:predicted nucleotidyltransferase